MTLSGELVNGSIEIEQMTKSQSIRFGDGRSFCCEPGDTFLSGALRSGVAIPYECNAGACGSCKITILEGDVYDYNLEAVGLKDRDRQRGKRLACQCEPLTDCVIEFKGEGTIAEQIRPVKATAIFAGSRQLTHDIYEFRFETNRPAEFLPGQYALLHFPELGIRRSYSMSNLSNELGLWEFQVRRVPHGLATSYLFDLLQPGTQIQLDGPYGNANLRTDINRNIVCIAGGSGLAPMVSIVRGVISSPALSKVGLHFFYGGREPRDMVKRELFPELFESGSRFNFIPVMSVGQSEEAGEWQGERGNVHESMCRHLDGQFMSSEFYLAGPPPMVDAVRKVLVLEHGVPVERIHYDRFF